jgi:hypothetical protein
MNADVNFTELHGARLLMVGEDTNRLEKTINTKYFFVNATQNVPSVTLVVHLP